MGYFRLGVGGGIEVSILVEVVESSIFFEVE